MVGRACGRLQQVMYGKKSCDANVGEGCVQSGGRDAVYVCYTLDARKKMETVMGTGTGAWTGAENVVVTLRHPNLNLADQGEGEGGMHKRRCKSRSK